MQQYLRSIRAENGQKSASGCCSHPAELEGMTQCMFILFLRTPQSLYSYKDSIAEKCVKATLLKLRDLAELRFAVQAGVGVRFVHIPVTTRNRIKII